MRFCPPTHKNKLDAENYLKPLLDGIAAGLFCNENEDVNKLENSKYDDSNFLSLYVERLPNTTRVNEEGVIVTISKMGKDFR